MARIKNSIGFFSFPSLLEMNVLVIFVLMKDVTLSSFYDWLLYVFGGNRARTFDGT